MLRACTGNAGVGCSSHLRTYNIIYHFAWENQRELQGNISYIAMCTRGLPDIYTLGPRALGVYIRQTTRAHGITIK